MKNYLLNFAQKHIPRWLVLFIDTFLVLQTFFLAYFIKYNFSIDFNIIDLFYQVPVILLLAVLSFLITGSYRGVIRHTGLRDALNVYIGVSLLSALMISTVIVVRLFNEYSSNYQLSFSLDIAIIVIHYLLNIIVLITSRFLFKYIYRNIISDISKSIPILIYGAGEMGSITYSTLNKDPENTYNVVGFIDDNVNNLGKKINRLPIFSPSNISADFVNQYKIKEVIIAIQNIKSKRILEIIDAMYVLGVDVKITPPLSKWLNGDLQLKQVKQVKIEDLLERSPINLDNPMVKDDMKGKTVFVTGAAGSIGSEISRQIASYDCEQLVLIDQSESALYDLEQELKRNQIQNAKVIVADVRDSLCMRSIFQKYSPDFVFHAAAYKHVPLMEENPYEAIKINVGGTKNIADLSLEFEVHKMVMVSTDKAVNPTNVMGATKRVAEMYVNSLNAKAIGKTKYITTRFGNVLGSNGSVIPLFKKQIEEGGPLTLTHKEITRFFMTIPEACQLVIEAGSMGNGGEIFIFDMGASVKIFDLAKRMIQLSGLQYPEDIDIKITGLRPGEKLYEELLNDSENTLPTHHEKIMIGKVAEFDKSKVISQIEVLCNNNTVDNALETVSLLKTIVPEFKSQNSSFVSLDT
ncbi:MAG: polysaccharide biosynthesis protein [Flavicella sp.]